MNHSPSLVNFIASFEGCVLKTYKDQNGIKTIGYGHTGADVEDGMVITKVRALLYLNADLAITDAQVTKVLKIPVSQNQFDALVSLVFNIGIGRFMTSTVLRDLNANNINAAANAFLLWDEIAGHESAGLLRRRQAEKTLFLTA